ncbi:SpoIIE family protein phosphatase [Blastococcus tunisiensis]|uniref:PAS domain S-box-containing protein n=1 Tax=Blastococcus tunisiensis TaxID=1798228 RepID=A0A1I2J4D1_9ACTN|nr:SpoIIE family protein phosphatase [Blastococcus sp. DSM 46838]SFF49602.1 PAS domain S-box-containing protein [Blastococcus sp. DSM 46838]
MDTAVAPVPADPDPLRDPERIAAARRLLLEVPGAAAFDRLSALASRLLAADHAKVTLFTDQDVVVGGVGLPEGVIGGPALLTGALSAIVVSTGAPLDIPEAAADARVAGLPAVTSGQVGAYLGAPLVAASGHVVGALAVYDPSPRPWSEDATELLQQLAASVVAELELSAAQSAVGTSRVRLEVALAASSIGIWERDLRTDTGFWDQRCARLFGLEEATEIEGFQQMMLERVHPEDHATAAEAMDRAVAERDQFTLESRIVRTDGQIRWVVSRGRVLGNARGEPVRILGTIIDVTEARRQAEQRLAAFHRATAIAEVAAELSNATRLQDLPEIVQRGAQVLGARSSALTIVDVGGGALRLHTTRRLADQLQEHVDRPVEGIEIEADENHPIQYAAVHGRRVLLSSVEEMLARFPATREGIEVLGIRAVGAFPLRVEGRVLGSFAALWQDERAFPADDVEVLEALAAQIALTVSRLQADAERVRAVAAMAGANERLQLLADAGRVLSGTLEIDQQVAELAELVVPELADWCWLVVTDEQGRLHDLACAHRDPDRREELESYVRGMVAVMTDRAGARVVMRSGRPMVMPVIDWGHIEEALPDPAVREALARLGAASATIVPLVARGQVLGALGLFNREERGPLSRAQVDTAIEIGRRAGLALHHARLFGQQRDLAVALQRSMLTAPPEPNHSEIVVRYVPAAAGAEIGGDWYDAFLQADGATVLAIGDVVGHDSRAAAAMGQVRGLLRGIAYSSGDGPAAVLSGLDRAVEGLALDTMATALVARLEQDGDDLRAGRAVLRWSSAGHPPAAVLTADGKAHLLDERADLLLGVFPDTGRHEHTTVLQHGTTVLLYTDGLVERRDRDIDAGTAELVAVLETCAGMTLQDLCDEVLERLFLPDAEDDVAILAVRLHPQDEPRPPEAGPQVVPPGVEPMPDVVPEAGTAT